MVRNNQPNTYVYVRGALYSGWIPLLKKVLPKRSPRGPARVPESTQKVLPLPPKSTPKVLPGGPWWQKVLPRSSPATEAGRKISKSIPKVLKKYSPGTRCIAGAPHVRKESRRGLPGVAGEASAALFAEEWSSSDAPRARGVLFQYFGNTF